MLSIFIYYRRYYRYIFTYCIVYRIVTLQNRISNYLIFLSVVDFVRETWSKQKENTNGQQIRFLASFYVDMNAQFAREKQSQREKCKEEALSVLKVSSQIEELHLITLSGTHDGH